MLLTITKIVFFKYYSTTGKLLIMWVIELLIIAQLCEMLHCNITFLFLKMELWYDWRIKFKFFKTNYQYKKYQIIKLIQC